MGMTALDKVSLVFNGARRRLGLAHNRGIVPFAQPPEDVPDDFRHSGPLHEIFFDKTVFGAKHKWLHYLDIYNENLSRYRGLPVRLLEIGVSRGGSLAMWRRYFGDQAIIYGIDIDPRCRVFDGQYGCVRIGSQDDRGFLQKVLIEMGGLDIVIDDGSHIMGHINTTFDCLFGKVSDNGVYICEDLHCAYWAGRYEGGYRRKTSFIERAKRIVDDVHADFHDRGCHDVLNANRKVKAIKFYNSVVVIEKALQRQPSHVAVGDFAFDLRGK